LLFLGQNAMEVLRAAGSRDRGIAESRDRAASFPAFRLSQTSSKTQLGDRVVVAALLALGVTPEAAEADAEGSESTMSPTARWRRSGDFCGGDVVAATSKPVVQATIRNI
jgi:hypothetical protein